MKIARIYYPWFSIFLGLPLIGWLLVSSQPELVNFYQIQPYWQEFNFNLAVTAVYFLILIAETGRFIRSKKLLQIQINQLWQSKKQVQTKAHTYSAHADKLKLFISDKLLEYIEYDEKFLHFKSIASEVRHNGVISYDKVKTALQLAIESENETLKSSNTDSEKSEKNGQLPATLIYQDALDAMRYLWDLLDLSTTDNIALHISNHLCECEEHFYQQQLNSNNSLPVPYKPEYSPRKAAMKTMNMVMHTSVDIDQDQLIDDVSIDVPGRVVAHFQPTAVLLGNENHLILLLENLLKNAQFFTGKKQGSNKNSPIRVALREENGFLHLSVYNAGPHIDEDNREKIYQLGFSSRRVKEDHGKGLGLFFVKQIVRGYEGKIAYKNIQNEAAMFDLVIRLVNGDVVHDTVAVVLDDKEKPMCFTSLDSEHKITASWQFKHRIQSIEVLAENDDTPDKFDHFMEKGITSFYEQQPKIVPRWLIEVNQRKGSKNLVFTPLNINGVQFNVRLPTADTYMDGGEIDETHNIDDEVERLDLPFQENRL